MSIEQEYRGGNSKDVVTGWGIVYWILLNISAANVGEAGMSPVVADVHKIIVLSNFFIGGFCVLLAVAIAGAIDLYTHPTPSVLRLSRRLSFLIAAASLFALAFTERSALMPWWMPWCPAWARHMTLLVITWFVSWAAIRTIAEIRSRFRQPGSPAAH